MREFAAGVFRGKLGEGFDGAGSGESGGAEDHLEWVYLSANDAVCAF
jgi:hypothetical protein